MVNKSPPLQRGPNSRESRFGYLDPRTVEILLQTGIELGQSAVLKVGNTLLLVLDITPGAKFVGRHGDGRRSRGMCVDRGAQSRERGVAGGERGPIVWTTEGGRPGRFQERRGGRGLGALAHTSFGSESTLTKKKKREEGSGRSKEGT